MIRADHICKTFKLFSSPYDRFAELLFRRPRHRDYHALTDVSFHVGQGETLGIIGSNGAGKSTLLKILTGVLMQNSGEVTIDGRITGLLELGTGFNEEFSGVDNIFLNGTLLGMTRPEIAERLDAIIAFTELGDFIREPLKTYSSGMIMRLAFSIAIHAEPQAFVVDEALSVGDAYFQQKCMRRIKEFKSGGGAIVFVSHDMSAVTALCDRAMLLEGGVVVEEGNPETIINAYNYYMAKRSRGEAVQFDGQVESSYGTFRAVIQHIALQDGAGHEASIFLSGAPCAVQVDIAAREAMDDLTVGILFRDRFGQDVFGTNTHLCNQRIALTAGGTARVTFAIPEFNLGPGKYSLSVALHKDKDHVDECFQWTDRAKSFEVVHGQGAPFVGVVRLAPELDVQVEG